ncbi:MAG: DNA methyltransferase, partial [Lactococcus sp.]
AFAGSATTLVVAKKQARNAIGFEKDERFFQMAKARIEAEQLELVFARPGQLPTHSKPYASRTTDLPDLVLA